MAPEKIAFTSRDLESAFGMTNREQVYLVDRGHLMPDIQAERPRLYSLYSGMKAGAVQFFEAHGYKLERADRLAEFAMVASSIACSDHGGMKIRDDIKLIMQIAEGYAGLIYFDIPGEGREPFLAFTAATSLNQDEAVLVERREYISTCTFDLKAMWGMLSRKLGADWHNVGELPTHVDEKIMIVRNEKDSLAGMIMFKSDPVKEIRI